MNAAAMIAWINIKSPTNFSLSLSIQATAVKTIELGDNGRTTNSSLSDLAAELKLLVAKDMGKPLAPSKIHFVSALPKTRNGKVMRRVIRSAYLGEDAGDLSALENPNAVDEIAKIKP